MYVQEITELRRQGELSKAFELAYNAWDRDKADPFLQMSLFWVLRDMCYRFFKHGYFEEVDVCLKEMKAFLPTMLDEKDMGKQAFKALYHSVQCGAEIILPALRLSRERPKDAFFQIEHFIAFPRFFDPLLREDLGWIMYRYLKEILYDIPSDEAKKLLEAYVALENPRPSLLHSQMLNYCIKFAKEHLDFKLYHFLQLWDPKLFREKDFQSHVYTEHVVPSLLERLVKQLVENNEPFRFEELAQSIVYPKHKLLELFRRAQYRRIVQFKHWQQQGNMLQAFKDYSTFNREQGPSTWHSRTLKLALWYLRGNCAAFFLDFFKVWSYRNFGEEDWRASYDKEDWRASYDKADHRQEALVTLVLQRCHDLLSCQRNKQGHFDWYANFLAQYMFRFPENKEAVRYQALLYHWQQKDDCAIILFKQLLRQTPDKHHLWYEAAQCLKDNIDARIIFLCKLLYAQPEETLLGNTRLTLAQALIRKGMMPAAKAELEYYLQNHHSKSYIARHLMTTIPTETIANDSNQDLYRYYAQYAEDLLND